MRTDIIIFIINYCLNRAGVTVPQKGSRGLRLEIDNRDRQIQKQPFRGVLGKRSSENMQQIYRRIPMPKCDFNKVTKPHY